MALAQTLLEARGYQRRDLFAIAEIARHYLFSGSAQLALVLFDGLAAIAPDEPYFALALALTHDRLGQKKEAEAEYGRAAELDPNDGRPDINRAELMLEAGDRARARTLLARGAEKATSSGDRPLERKARSLLARVEASTPKAISPKSAVPAATIRKAR